MAGRNGARAAARTNRNGGSPLPGFEAKVQNGTARIGIIGLGYVGLPLAVEFAKKGFRVTGFEIPRDGLRTDPGQCDLPLKVVGIGDIHIERNLTVNAHGLYLLHNCRFGTLQHSPTQFPNAASCHSSPVLISGHAPASRGSRSR